MNLRQTFNNLLRHRFGPAFLLFSLFILFSFITRVLLLLFAWGNIGINPLLWLPPFLIGLLYDVAAGLFFTAPLMLYLWLLPLALFRQKWHRFVLYTYFIISLFILVFNVGGELIFWQEYGNRYDFIAVDYLVYTHEVIGNIVESYPIFWILGGIFAAAVFIFILIRKKITLSAPHPARFAKRTVIFLAYAAAAMACFFFLTNRYRRFSHNNYANELAGNGMYEFGTAYFTNQLDYYKYYLTIPDKEAFELVRKNIAQPNAVFGGDNAFSTYRSITDTGGEKKWNIVYITVESLSGSYMAYKGSKQKITPFLDSLAQHALFFSNFYATGTRTVRGLEALSLAIPPTPGQSIVRRPHNSDLFTAGNVLTQKGYECKFVYGGNAWFDNMGPYFGANGYAVVDKRDFSKNDIHHTTTWGACDEDIFTQALKECDKSYTAGKPFFNQVLTVSNHRPYTFPKGRVPNNPDDQSRDGAVTYTDWAINDFLKRAQAKPWFSNTVFVIVADHCASAAGKVELPVTGYQVPCFIYAPQLVLPANVTRMVSQIDLLPTLFGLMNMRYPSKFFGYDIFELEPGRERAFISTYQKLGYIKNGNLVILSPRKQADMYRPDFTTGEAKKVPIDSVLLKEAIAYYQTASYMFNKGLYGK